MKNHFKKILFIFIGLIVGITVFFMLSFIGNPISEIIATRSAKSYVAKKFPNEELVVEKSFYNFKDGYYNSRVRKENSEDFHFIVAMDYKGKVLYDDYESGVLSGFNTWRRLDEEYRKLGDTVLESDNFPYESDISYAILNMYEKDEPYGIKSSELELDKKYNINDLGQKYGKIVIYLYDEDVSVKKASEMMIEVKKLLDEGGVPFRTMDFNLSLPKEEDKPKDWEKSLAVENFLYEEIYEEGLEDRIEKANKELKAYYEILDKEKNN